MSDESKRLILRAGEKIERSALPLDRGVLLVLDSFRKFWRLILVCTRFGFWLGCSCKQPQQTGREDTAHFVWFIHDASIVAKLIGTRSKTSRQQWADATP